MSSDGAPTSGPAAAAPPICRIVVMASGSGTNLQALIDGVASGAISAASIVGVVTNRKTAFAAERARAAGIPADYFNLVAGGFQAKGEKDPARMAEARERYDAALAERVLASFAPDLVVLAGWMHVFTETFLRPLRAAGVPVINLHPALPGCYDGANAIARAYEDFRAGRLEGNRTGVMVHYVIAEVDRGAPILTEEVECHEGESLEQLEEQMHRIEHQLIVKATAQVAAQLVARKPRQ